jgi:hypothetical protein
MPSAADRVLIPLRDAAPHLLDGDVVLFRGTGLVATCIAVAGLSEYAHAGMIGRVNGDYANLMLYEMLWSGGAGTTLASQVAKRPGLLDVYRVSDSHTKYAWAAPAKMQVWMHCTLDRKKAVAIMRGFCRPGEYGKMHLLWTALTRIPVIRFFCRPPTNDELEDRTRPPYCSEAVAFALRKSFTDVVRNTPDHYTSPGALAQSPLLHYMFTLTCPTQ